MGLDARLPSLGVRGEQEEARVSHNHLHFGCGFVGLFDDTHLMIDD